MVRIPEDELCWEYCMHEGDLMSSHRCQATDWDGALLGQEYQLVNVMGQGVGLG